MAIGVSAKLQYESGSTYHDVDRVRSVNFPHFNISAIDSTNLGNTDFGMTYEPGMIDADVITFESIHSDGSYTTLTGLVRQVVNWKVTGPDGEATVVTCDGFLTKLDVNITATDLMVIQGEIRLTGVPEVTGG